MKRLGEPGTKMISANYQGVTRVATVKTENALPIATALRIVRDRWPIAAFSLLVGVALAVVFQLFFPPKYESTSQILVMKKDARLAAKGMESGSEGELRVTEDILATHMQLLQSRTIVDAAIKADQLAELDTIKRRTEKGTNAYEYILDNLAVSRGGLGQARAAHVLNIAYRSPSSTDAEAVLRAVVKSYQRFLASKFQDVNQEAATLIERAQSQLANELEEVEQRYERFRQSSPFMMWKRNGEESTNVHRVRYEELQQELATLRLQIADASGRMDAIDERLAGRELADLSDLERLSLVDEKNMTRVGMFLTVQRGESQSPEFQAKQPFRLEQARLENVSLMTLQLKLQSLLQELGPEHPEILALRSQISAMKDFGEQQSEGLKPKGHEFELDSQTLFNAYRKVLENDLLSMRQREKRLQGLSAEEEELAKDLVKFEIEGDALRKEVKRRQDLYDAAVDRLREINLAKDYGGFIDEVIAEPERGKQVMPRPLISAAFGIFCAFFLTALGVGVAEHNDRRFHSVEEVQTRLQVPVVGRIPAIGNLPVLSKAQLSKGRRFVAKGAGLLLQTDSAEADAFRALRTTLVFGNGEDDPRVLAVTSPRQGDGKSTVSANLAASLGQLGRSVLVIDCDLRLPNQHNLFNIDATAGLTNVLSENLDPADAIQATGVTNVWLMPRGKSVPNPAEFLVAKDFLQLIETLRTKYDHVILDCPPVITVVETTVICSRADATMLVIQSSNSNQHQAEWAVSALREVGVEPAGVVMNGLRPGEFQSYGYGYGYGYGHRYGERASAPVANGNVNRLDDGFSHGTTNGRRPVSTTENGLNGN